MLFSLWDIPSRLYVSMEMNENNPFLGYIVLFCFLTKNPTDPDFFISDVGGKSIYS